MLYKYGKRTYSGAFGAFCFYFSLVLFWWRFNKTITPLSLVVVTVSFYILGEFCRNK